MKDFIIAMTIIALGFGLLIVFVSLIIQKTQAGSVSNEEVTQTVSKFRDGDTVCYVAQKGQSWVPSAISCVRTK